MGYERKRGKLADLNALLRGGARRPLLADRRRHRRRSRDVQYVITLDTDTQLPRDAARQLVGRDGASAQPARATTTRSAARRRGLRHPAAARRRRACPAPAARGSRGCSAASRASIRTRARSPTSTRTCSAKARSSARASTTSTRSSRRSTGASPRTASSATTCSKAATRAPACSATCSCSRSIPSRYGADVEPPPPLDPRRLADRRLAAAAGARAPTGGAAQPALARCRAGRSSTTCAAASCRRRCCCCCCSAGRCWRPPWLLDARRCWRCCCCPPLIASLLELLRKPDDVPLAPAPAPASLRCGRAAPGAGRCSRSPACRTRPASASTRSCARCGAMLVTRRRLLEWTPSSDAAAQRAARASPASFARDVDRAGARRRRSALSWLRRAARRAGRWPRRSCCCGSLSPAARLVAQPAARAPQAAARRRADARSCASVARRTWRFFETFVGPDDNWLPPDNFQEQPGAGVAHRTSPTNIGLALLANLAALRLRLPHRRRSCSSAPTQHAAPRWSGWSATAATSTTGTTRRRCSRCAPRYVSTVDSGNLAGHLLTLRAGPAGAGRRSRSLGDAAVRRACATRCGLLHETRAAAPRRLRRSTRCASAARRGAASAAADAGRCGRRCSTRWRAAQPSALAGGRRRRPTPRGAPLGTRRSTPVPDGRDDAAARAAGRRLLPRADAARRCRAARSPTLARAGGAAASWPRPRAARGSRALRRLADARRRRSPRWTSSFLYDPARHLLAIGYNVGEQRRDAELLRPARLRSAAGQLRRHRAGPAAAGAAGSRSGRLLTTSRRRADRCCRGAARCSST